MTARFIEGCLWGLLFGALAWTAFDEMMAARASELVRHQLAVLEAQKTKGSTAYYGERSDWYHQPCCLTLWRWDGVAR